jgi:ABC-type nitrate/sulfonate/bicarbonate transport system substrate-binding protein
MEESDMNMMFRAFALIGMAATVSLASGAMAQSSPPAMVRLGIAYPEPEVLPFFVAQEKGFFREENIASEMISLNSGDKIAFALLGGSVELAIYTPDWIVRAIEKGGGDLKIVLGGSNVPQYSLLVPNEIQSYADLKGKRFAVSTIKASDTYLLKRMLAANGLKDTDTILIQAGSSPERAAALRNGSVSGTLMIPPLDQIVVDDGRFKRLDYSAKTISRFTWKAQATRQEWAKANRAVLVRYMRAWIKGTRWMRDPANKEEALKLLTKHIRYTDQYARISYDLLYSENGSVARDAAIDFPGLQEVVNSVVAQGDLPPPAPDAKKYVDTSYWDEAEKSLH